MKLLDPGKEPEWTEIQSIYAGLDDMYMYFSYYPNTTIEECKIKACEEDSNYQGAVSGASTPFNGPSASQYSRCKGFWIFDSSPETW